MNLRARPELETEEYKARGRSLLVPEATCSLNFNSTVVTFTDCFQVFNISSFYTLAASLSGTFARSASQRFPLTYVVKHQLLSDFCAVLN